MQIFRLVISSPQGREEFEIKRVSACPNALGADAIQDRMQVAGRAVQKDRRQTFDQQQMREGAAMHAGAHARFLGLITRYYRLMSREVNGCDASQRPQAKRRCRKLALETVAIPVRRRQPRCGYGSADALAYREHNFAAATEEVGHGGLDAV
jgi:hypothetical protein